MNRQMRAKLTTVLIAANAAVLGVTAWFVWASLRPPTLPAVAPTLAPSTESQAGFRYQSVSTDHLATNPVFSPSRVWLGKAEAAQPPPPAVVRPRLVGIATEYSQRRALLEDPVSQQRMFVSVGQAFLGWKVVAIERETITLLPPGDSPDTAHDRITLHLHQHDDAWISAND